MGKKKAAPLQIKCPGCGWTRSFPAEKLSKIRGKKIRCPECYQVSQVTERTKLQELSSNDGKRWAKASFICGTLGLISFFTLIGGGFFGAAAIIFYGLQRKPNKFGTAGLVMAIITIFLTVMTGLAALPMGKVVEIQEKADQVREKIAKWEDRKKDALESKVEAKKRLREIKEKLKQKKEKLEKLE